METQLKGLSVAWGLRGVLKGKIYENVNTVFQFLAGVIEYYIGWMKEFTLTKVPVLYSGMMLIMTTNNSRRKVGVRSS